MSLRAQLIIGVLLNGVAWWSAWSEAGPLRHHSFFPLWLGYILIVDGLLRWRSGSSLLARLGGRSVWLFVVSAPIWWIFEAVNSRLGNWHYVVPHEYSWLRYRLEASLAFSTVVPAIFVTAELIRSLVITRPIHWMHVAPDRRGLTLVSITGAAMMLLSFLVPNVFFPLVWIGLFQAIDPISFRLGGHSITSQVRTGRWDTVIVLFLATLTCGFFWEFWNYWSMPKWEYRLPWAGWLRVFEMPLLGFGGYFPFGLEVFALVCLLDRIVHLDLMSVVRFDKTPD